MPTPENVSIADLVSLKSQQAEIVSEAQRRLEAVETVMTMLRPSEEAHAPNQSSREDQEPGEAEPDWRSKAIIDLSGAKNLTERLILMVQGWGGVINAMEAAEYLVAHGHSKSTPHLLRPHVSNALNDCPDFVKIRQGTFQYVPESDNFMTEGGCESGTTTI